MWHYGWHPFLCVWVPVRESLCFGVKLMQRACVRDLPWVWKDEGRKVPEISWQRIGEEDSQHERAVKRTQSAEGSSRDQLKEQDSRQRWKQGREDKSALLVALWVFSLNYTLAFAHRIHKKCHRLPTLALGADPSSCLFVSSTFLVVLCVSVKECEIPLARDEKNH